jgi:Tol biopolymer transport system component
LYVGSINGGDAKFLTNSLCNAAVVNKLLLFCRDDKLFAQPLDFKRFTLRGEPQLLVSSLMTDPSTWRGIFSADSGLLAYAPGTQGRGTELVWMDRTGRRLGRFGEIREYYVLSLSRDGKRLAVEVADPGPNTWIADISRGTFSRLTFVGSSTRQPAISPDGREVIFASEVNDGVAIVRKSTSGLGQEQVLLSGKTETVPNDWSADGKYVLLQRGESGKEYGLFALELFGAGRMIPLINIPGQQFYDGSVSPDMKWFLYTSPVNGLEEIFVSPFDTSAAPNRNQVMPSARWQISNGGGLGRWSRDGREIYYISSDGKMMSVSVHGDANGFEAAAPKELFPLPAKNMIGMSYVVSPDGKFLVNSNLQPLKSPVELITNWKKLLKQ